MSQKRIPNYRKHKATGQAVVTINGKDFYLGRHGTAASKKAYDRLIAQYLRRAINDARMMCPLRS